MINRITRPQLKRLLQSTDELVIYVGYMKNGVFWGGTYKTVGTTGLAC